MLVSEFARPARVRYILHNGYSPAIVGIEHRRNVMTHSEPACRNYISEDLCAASSHRPEVHCYDDDGQRCANFTPEGVETTQGKKRYVVSLDMED